MRKMQSDSLVENIVLQRKICFTKDKEENFSATSNYNFKMYILSILQVL